jgi:hypothetical protein
MPAAEPYDPVSVPVGIIQPCSEACACFQRLAGGGWSDYGLCTNPRSPHHGSPVRLGQECDDYQPTADRSHPRQD